MTKLDWCVFVINWLVIYLLLIRLWEIVKKFPNQLYVYMYTEVVSVLFSHFQVQYL